MQGTRVRGTKIPNAARCGQKQKQKWKQNKKTRPPRCKPSPLSASFAVSLPLLSCVVGRTMAPKGVHVQILEPVTLLPYTVNGFCRWDEVTDLTQGDSSGLSGWAQCLCKGNWGRRVRGRERCDSRNSGQRDAIAEGWHTSQGMQAASRSWKRQGTRMSPRISRMNTILLTPWF